MKRMLPVLILIHGLFYLLSCADNTAPEENISGMPPQAAAQESLSVRTPDTAEINALLQQGIKMAGIHRDSAMLIFKETLLQSGTIGYEHGIITSYRQLALIAEALQDAKLMSYYKQEAVHYIKGRIQTYRYYGHDRDIWRLYNGLMLLYKEFEDYNSMIQLYHAIKNRYPYTSAAVQNEDLFHIHYNGAIAYYHNGLFDSAYYYFQQLEAALKNTAYPQYGNLGKVYVGLGIVLSKYVLKDLVVPYFDSAVKLAVQHRDTALYLSVLKNISSHYFTQNQYKEAIAMSGKLLKLAALSGDADALLHGHHIMAASLLKENRPGEALGHSLKYAALAAGSSLKSDRLQGDILLGYNYNQLGQYSNAEQHLRNGIRLAEETGNTESVINGYSQLSVACFRMGKYRLSALYNGRIIPLIDSLFRKSNAARIAEMEIKYRSAEKDKSLLQQALLLAQKNNDLRTRNIIIVAIIAGSIAVIGLLFALYLNNKHKQRLQADQLQHIRQQEKIKLLLAQMEGVEWERSRLAQELHDGVGGLLAAVRMNFSVLEQKHGDLKESAYYKETLALLQDSASQVRKTAHNLMPGLLVHQRLDEALCQYCGKINAGHPQTEIAFQAYGMERPLKDELKRTVFFIVQELITNVIKHAGATQALVQLSARAGLLHVMVEDNGKGLNGTGKNGGLGLTTLQERVAALGGHSHIQSEPGAGTTIDIEFPLDENGH